MQSIATGGKGDTLAMEQSYKLDSGHTLKLLPL
jgi:hypothetical protein